MLGGSKTRTNNPGSFYGSFCEGYGHFWSLQGKISEDFSGQTVENVTKLRSSKADSHVVPLVIFNS